MSQILTPEEIERLGWLIDNPRVTDAAEMVIECGKVYPNGQPKSRDHVNELKAVRKTLEKLSPEARSHIESFFRIPTERDVDKLIAHFLNANQRVAAGQSVVDELIQTLEEHPGQNIPRRRKQRIYVTELSVKVLAVLGVFDDDIPITRTKGPLIGFLKIVKHHINSEWDARQMARDFVSQYSEPGVRAFIDHWRK